MREIRTAGKIHARVTAPPSKSYTNRALIAAALAEGESLIENPLHSDDTHYMVQALRQFGVDVHKGNNDFRVIGTGGRIHPPGRDIYVGNAGTAMRFLTTLAALSPEKTVLTGDSRMRERPIGDLLQALSRLGFSARSVHANDCPPIEITGGRLRAARIRLRGDLSSQYLTSLLLSLPAFGKEITLEVTGMLTSASYIDITLEVMADFGIRVERKGNAFFCIREGQVYRARRYRVQGDASSASYFFAAAAVTGGGITVQDIDPETPQGDIRFVELLGRMGCEVSKGKNFITVKGQSLHGVEADMNLMPDAVQTAAVTALFARGETRISNIGNLRIKETDRIAALASELRKLGAEVDEGRDWIIIRPGPCRGAEIKTYNDHRMAMAFAVAGLRIPGVKIENPGCVKKSFPRFFTVWGDMGG